MASKSLCFLRSATTSSLHCEVLGGTCENGICIIVVALPFSHNIINLAHGRVLLDLLK